MHSHSWSLVVTRGQLVVTRGHSWSLVVIRGHLWSLVVTRGHSCVLLDTTLVHHTAIIGGVNAERFNDFLRDARLNLNPDQLIGQPRSQGLSLPAPQSERRETLVGSGHVPPRIWGVTKKSLMGGAA